MGKANTLLRGINFGNWLSTTGLADKTGVDRKITADDFRRVAEWGVDHVRLPVDFEEIESSASPRLLPRGIKAIEQAVKWSRDAGLGLVLALDRAPGMEFKSGESEVWSAVDIQCRIVNLWRRLSARLHHPDADHVVFELLSSPAPPSHVDWMAVARMALNAIRSVDQERTVLIGPSLYLPGNLLPLGVFNDEHLIYAFCFYQPIIFTHQSTRWRAQHGNFDLQVEYPSVLPDLSSYADGLRDQEARQDLLRYSEADLDRELLAAALMPVRVFRRRTGAEVYCAEFGVHSAAGDSSTAAWITDVVGLFAEHGIGWSYWDYRGPFGLVRDDGQVSPTSELLFGRGKGEKGD